MIEAKFGDVFARISPPTDDRSIGYSQTGTVVAMTDETITLVVNVDMPRNMTFRRDTGFDTAGIGSFIVRPDWITREAYDAEHGMRDIAGILGMDSARLDAAAIVAKVKALDPSQSPWVLPLGLTVAAYNAGQDVMIEAVTQPTGPDLWAVRFMGDVLNSAGEWEYEPQPTSRTDAFIARCRFATPSEAYSCLQRARLKV